MLLWLESHLQGLQYNSVGRTLDVGQKKSEIYFTKVGSPEFSHLSTAIFQNSDLENDSGILQLFIYQ